LDVQINFLLSMIVTRRPEGDQVSTAPYNIPYNISYFHVDILVTFALGYQYLFAGIILY